MPKAPHTKSKRTRAKTRHAAPVRKSHHVVNPPIQWVAALIVGAGVFTFVAGGYLLVVSGRAPEPAPAPQAILVPDDYDVRVESEMYTPDIDDTVPADEASNLDTPLEAY